MSNALSLLVTLPGQAGLQLQEGLLVLCVKHILLQPFKQGLSATTRVQVSGSAVSTKILQEQGLQHVAELRGIHCTCKEAYATEQNRRQLNTA